MMDIFNRAAPGQALACVMGGMNLIRPIGLAGIPCAAITRPSGSTRYSRFIRTAISWEGVNNGEELTGEFLETLVRFGMAQPVPPVLFYEQDAHLLFISRNRERLAQAFRFVAADPALVEDLVDKTRFQALAARLGLPVPATRCLRSAGASEPPELDMRFPVVIKPANRDKLWSDMESGKARQVNGQEELRQLWPHFLGANQDLLAQELVPGPESRIESYHVYVDRDGGIAADFTGRKIRTKPEAYGHTTSLLITDTSDVRDLGRELTRRLGLRGVAKFDFKRGPDDRLHLLEVNPRFNLWHFAGAVAGINLPALVYADLVGRPRPAMPPVRAGVRWCHVLKDAAAARALGMPLAAWAFEVVGYEAMPMMSWDDPMPLLHTVWRFLSSEAARVRLLGSPKKVSS